jgi:hypothetical protein
VGGRACEDREDGGQVAALEAGNGDGGQVDRQAARGAQADEAADQEQECGRHAAGAADTAEAGARGRGWQGDAGDAQGDGQEKLGGQGVRE